MGIKTDWELRRIRENQDGLGEKKTKNEKWREEKER